MDITARVKELNLPRGLYAVFGSGPLAVRKLRDARDIDIVITSELFKSLAKDPAWTVGQVRDHHRVLTRGDVELFDSWAPGSWDISALIRAADIIDGIPYVRLESVIEWKDLRNTSKDVNDIKLIKQYLARTK